MIIENEGIGPTNVSGGIAGTTTTSLPGVTVKNMKSGNIPTIMRRNKQPAKLQTFTQKTVEGTLMLKGKSFSSFMLSLDEAKLKTIPDSKPDVQASPVKGDISNSLASELFARCRAAATTTHFAHLSTESFAEHKALDTFYTDIIDEIDAFCEAYIGLYGKFITLPPIAPQMQEGEPAVEELRDWVLENRTLITDDSSLQNAIDDIVTLCNSTIYKLQKLH